MKKHLPICMILVSCFMAMAAKAPNFTMTDIHGKTHTLSEYVAEGKYVLIDMFATWCGPCKMTAGPLGEVCYDYGDNKRSLVVLGVSVDTKDTKPKIEQFEKNYGGDYSYPVVPGTDPNMSAMKTKYKNAGLYKGSIPTLVLVEGTTGNVLYAKAGGKNKSGLLQLLRENNVPNEEIDIISSALQLKESKEHFIKSTATGMLCNVPSNGTYALTLHTLSGRELFSQSLELNTGQNSFSFDQSNLSTGQVVLVSLQGGGITTLTKLVIQ